jgi:hypothetical protein
MYNLELKLGRKTTKTLATPAEKNPDFRVFFPRRFFGYVDPH